MIRKIAHQIWNERRHNSLIVAALLLTTIFIWMISDPLYVIMATKAIPDNYEKKERYCVELNFDFYQMISNEDNGALFNLLRNIMQNVAKLPEVENYITTSYGSEFNPSVEIFDELYTGTESNKKSKQKVYLYNYFWEGNPNMFNTIGLKDANNGKPLLVPEKINIWRGIFISSSTAMTLFGTTDIAGKELNESYEILGVYEDFQIHAYREPVPSAIVLHKPSIYNFSTNYAKRIVQLKSGTDIDAFEEKLEKIRSGIDPENEFEISLMTMDEMMQESNGDKEARYTINQKIALNSFALICIFLCMLGTFWVRMDNRRGDIGIMRTMGASRNRIMRQYITEAVMLLSVAVVAALPLLIHIVYTDGFAEPGICNYNKEYFTPNPQYAVNNRYIHFATVTAITYVTMLLITIVGTLIPVYRATRILPADALREE